MSDLSTLRARVEAAQVKARENAVFNVDAAYGYTVEFAPCYADHRRDYDDEEARLRDLFGVTLATDALGIAESQAAALDDIRAALRLPASTPWPDVLARARSLAERDPARTLDDEGLGGGDGGGR